MWSSNRKFKLINTDQYNAMEMKIKFFIEKVTWLVYRKA